MNKFFIAILLIVAAPIWADMISLTNGSKIQGRVVEKKNGLSIVVLKTGGMTAEIKNDEIVKIEIDTDAALGLWVEKYKIDKKAADTTADRNEIGTMYAELAGRLHQNEDTQKQAARIDALAKKYGVITDWQRAFDKITEAQKRQKQEEKEAAEKESAARAERAKFYFIDDKYYRVPPLAQINNRAMIVQLRVGSFIKDAFRDNMQIFQVIDDANVIAKYGDVYIRFSGWDTSKMVDGEHGAFGNFAIVGTWRYKTTLGGSNQIFLALPLDRILAGLTIKQYDDMIKNGLTPQ